MSKHHRLDYLELPCTEIDASKAFFTSVFGWSFVDYGPDYCCTSGQPIEVGFFRSEQSAKTSAGSALTVLFSSDLAASEKAVMDAGGVIVKPVFEFPGGRRFQFEDPSGNEFAVWAE
jgi:predicted enzyme related to lactoylglutathione lyase